MWRQCTSSPKNMQDSSFRSNQTRCLRAHPPAHWAGQLFVSAGLQPSDSTSSRCLAIYPQVEAACSTLHKQWMEPLVNNKTAPILSGNGQSSSALCLKVSHTETTIYGGTSVLIINLSLCRNSVCSNGSTTLKCCRTITTHRSQVARSHNLTSLSCSAMLKSKKIIFVFFVRGIYYFTLMEWRTSTILLVVFQGFCHQMWRYVFNTGFFRWCLTFQ